jgi:hypothetical protein
VTGSCCSSCLPPLVMLDLKLPRSRRSQSECYQCQCQNTTTTTATTTATTTTTHLARSGVRSQPADSTFAYQCRSITLIMASHHSPSDSTYSVSNETSPSSLFLHDFDSEVFEVSLIFQKQLFTHCVCGGPISAWSDRPVWIARRESRSTKG